MLLQEVTAAVHDAGPFSVIADGISDISHCEQMSLTLCYENNGNIYEAFVGYVLLKKQNAEAITTAIKTKTKLIDMGFNLINMVGYGYNGVSVMSGQENGVQALIHCEYLTDLFVHCQSHHVNLSIWSSSNIHKVQAVHMMISDVQSMLCLYFCGRLTRAHMLLLVPP